MESVPSRLRSRVPADVDADFRKVKNQERIFLRIGTGQQMKQVTPRLLDIRARLNSPAKQFWRRITHGPYSGDALLFLLHHRAIPKSITITRPVLRRY